jgi:hypothetical protein
MTQTGGGAKCVTRTIRQTFLQIYSCKNVTFNIARTNLLHLRDRSPGNDSENEKKILILKILLNPSRNGVLRQRESLFLYCFVESDIKN